MWGQFLTLTNTKITAHLNHWGMTACIELCRTDAICPSIFYQSEIANMTLEACSGSANRDGAIISALILNIDHSGN